MDNLMDTTRGQKSNRRIKNTYENRVFEYSFIFKKTKRKYSYAVPIGIEEQSCPAVILIINIGPANDIK